MQQTYAERWVNQVIRPVVRNFSPFDADKPIDMRFGEPITDPSEIADMVTSIREETSLNERREKLDLPKRDEEEADIPTELREDEGGDDPFGGGGGLFSDAAEGRTLAEVPDNAVSISDRSEAPEGAQVIEGDRGGLYYIPQGTDLSPEQADDIVKDKITDMDIDAVDETTRETALKKYERTAIDNADRIKDPDVAIQTFDNIGEMFVNDFRTGINFSAGKENVDQASFEIQASARDSTFHHEFGHAIADAYGYGVSPDAAREGDLKYDSNEDNFVDIDLDRDDVDEFKLTKLEDGEAPEEVENLIEATNEAWEKMQQTSSEGGDVSDVVVRDNYGSISAHETLAQMHETMQTDVLPTSGHANFFDEHPNLTKAYVEVAEPAPRMKDLLTHLHNDRGEENSPFDSDPYPEREV